MDLGRKSKSSVDYFVYQGKIKKKKKLKTMRAMSRADTVSYLINLLVRICSYVLKALKNFLSQNCVSSEFNRFVLIHAGARDASFSGFPSLSHCLFSLICDRMAYACVSREIIYWNRYNPAVHCFIQYFIVFLEIKFAQKWGFIYLNTIPMMNNKLLKYCNSVYNHSFVLFY